MADAEERGLGVYPPGESPFETGTASRRYGLREIPMDADSSSFAVWNVFTAGIGYFTAYCSCFNGRRSGGYISQFSPHFIGFIRRIIDDIRILLSIPVRLITLVWGWLVFLWGLFTITYSINIPVVGISIPVPLPIWLLLYLAFFYLINAFWPFVLLITVTIVIPFINIALLILSFAFNLLIITLRITFTMYNMNVPFLGIEIYFMLTMVFTVLEIIFKLLESSGIMEIFQSFMEIIFFLIDMIMQVIMVFMQLQMSVLQIMAEVISYMVKLVMVVVEYCMAILTWIIDYLFRILEPILFVIQYIASAFSWMMGSSSTAAYTSRSLLEFGTGMSQKQLISLGLSGLALSSGGSFQEGVTPIPSPAGGAVQDYVSYTSSIYQQWLNHTISLGGDLTESQRIDGMHGVREFLKEVSDIRLEGKNDLHRVRDSYFASLTRGLPDGWGETVTPDSFGRKLLESRNFERSAGIKDAKPAQKVSDDISMVDQTTEIFMRHFHSGVKNMVQDPYTNMDLMHRSMQQIREHQRKGTDEYSIIAIMSEYEADMGLRHGQGLPTGPAHLRYVNHPDHPAELHNYFTDERKDYADRHSIPSTYAEYQKRADPTAREKNSGRSLLETWTDVHSLHAEHLGRMEKDHAKQIAEQARTYKDHHRKRVHTASTLGHGLRKAIYEHGQTVLHPDVLSAHGQSILERFGFKSLKQAYEYYAKEHGSPEQFWLSMVDFRSNPFFASFFHSYDRMNEHPHFQSWMAQFNEEETLRVKEERPAADHFNSKRLSEVLGPDHRLVNARANGKRSLLESKNKLEGLEIIATTTCWSEPRNPLCMPDLSWVPIWSPSTIALPDTITEDSSFCLPWEPSTQIWSIRRLLNGWYSIVFLLGAFPPLNYFLHGFTLVVPWMAWSVNWVFAVVPGGELASFEDIFCFFIHIYDLFILVVTYCFFRYIIYPILEELIFRPIQLNITAHNMQYQIQTRALQMAEDDPRLERSIRVYYAMLQEQDQVYQQRIARLGRQSSNNTTTIVNQGPETINAPIFNQININAAPLSSIDPRGHVSFQNFKTRVEELLCDPNLSTEEHARLQRLLFFLLNSGREANIEEYDPDAAEIGRLGLLPSSSSSLLTHRRPHDADL